jgi:uncharacterized membrane protein YbhN (UPF0104 family)
MKRLLPIALRAGLTLGAVAVVIVLSPLGDLRAALARVLAAGPWGALVLLPALAAITLDAHAWRLLLRRAGGRRSLAAVWTSRLAGQAIAIALPAGTVLGDATSAALLGGNRKQALASAAAKRLVVVSAHGVFVLLAVLVGGAALVTSSRALVGADWLPGAVALGGVALLALGAISQRLASHPALAARVRSMLRREPSDAGERGVMQRLLSSLPKRCTAVLVCVWLAEALESWVALRIVGADVPLSAVLAVEATVSILRALAFFTPAGLGVQDAGYVTMLAALGVPPVDAAGFAMLKRAKDALFLLLGGSALALSGRRLHNRAHEAALDAPPVVTRSALLSAR